MIAVVADVEEISVDARHSKKNALPLPGFFEKAGNKAYSIEIAKKSNQCYNLKEQNTVSSRNCAITV